MLHSMSATPALPATHKPHLLVPQGVSRGGARCCHRGRGDGAPGWVPACRAPARSCVWRPAQRPAHCRLCAGEQRLHGAVGCEAGVRSSLLGGAGGTLPSRRVCCTARCVGFESLRAWPAPQMDYCPETLVGWAQPRSWRLDDAQLAAVALPVAQAVAAMHSLQPPLAHRWVAAGIPRGVRHSCGGSQQGVPSPHRSLLTVHGQLPALHCCCCLTLLPHRDLKAENVLLGPHGGWVLCDFGSASGRHGVLESAHDIALEEEVVRKYTTPAYRAPEVCGSALLP